MLPAANMPEQVEYEMCKAAQHRIAELEAELTKQKDKKVTDTSSPEVPRAVLDIVAADGTREEVVKAMREHYGGKIPSFLQKEMDGSKQPQAEKSVQKPPEKSIQEPAEKQPPSKAGPDQRSKPTLYDQVVGLQKDMQEIKTMVQGIDGRLTKVEGQVEGLEAARRTIGQSIMLSGKTNGEMGGAVNEQAKEIDRLKSGLAVVANRIFNEEQAKEMANKAVEKLIPERPSPPAGPP